MRKLAFTLTIVGLASSAPALAQTDVPAGGYADETWTVDGSPYLVHGAVSFETLTVGAGTQVLIASVDQSLDIRASSLTVSGEPNRPVRFEAQTPSDTHSWYGLIATTATVTHAVFRHANSALTTRGTVTNSVFEDNVWGLELRGDSLVDSCTFDNTSLGVFFAAGTPAELRITNSAFVGHSLDGIACNGSACVISNCTFDANRFGVYVAGEATVRNSIFSNNTYAIQLMGSAAQVSHSNFWQNMADLDGSVVEGEGNTRLDPEYVAASDFHLRATSPCIDAGDAIDAPDHDREGTARPIEGDGEPDADGSSYDMGAYEYDPDPEGEAGQNAGGEGGKAGDSAVTGGSGTTAQGGTAGSPSGGSGARAGSEGGETTTAAVGSGANSTGALSSGGANSVSTGSNLTSSDGSSEPNLEDPDRLSKGCGCGVAERAPRGTLAGLLLLVATRWRRYRP